MVCESKCAFHSISMCHKKNTASCEKCFKNNCKRNKNVTFYVKSPHELFILPGDLWFYSSFFPVNSDNVFLLLWLSEAELKV